MSPTWNLPTPEHPPVGESSLVEFSAIQLARMSMLLSTAQGNWLTILGQNYGIPRPPLSDDDDLYRGIIPVLAWQPKTIKNTLYALIGAVLGTQDSIVASGNRAWQVYEVNANEIVIEIPLQLIGTSNTDASYLHGFYGYGFVTGGSSTNTFTAIGDATQAASSLVGLALHFNTSSNTWTDYTILSASYSTSTNLTTFVVSASTIPSGGGKFYVEVPGDGVSSFTGDFLATSGFVGNYDAVDGGGGTTTLKVIGDATTTLLVDDSVTIAVNGIPTVTTITGTSGYSLTTNVTTYTVALTIHGSQTLQSIVQLSDVDDQLTTVPSSERVFLTGDGLYEIVEFYLDLLAHAAGVTVRLETL
jgi:hypothetical protein